MDMRTDGIDARAGVQAPRGRKDKDKDGAAITLDPLKKALRDLGHLAVKHEEAREKLNEAVKAVAKKSGLNASTVRGLIRAHSGDHAKWEDAKAKAEQVSLVFEEIAYEGEITKTAIETTSRQ